MRDELTLYAGPSSPTGAPSWSLHDPVRNLYFRIDWLTFEILCRWQLADADSIAQALQQETTLQVDAQAVSRVVDFVQQHELIKRSTAQDSRAQTAQTERRQPGWMTRLLHHYLFFRVPLWRPDAWLGRTLPWVGWCASRGFVWLTLAALLLGLVEVSRQWDRFTATLVDLFSLQGVLAYGVTLVCVKFLHELGHAYTAKRYGCRVPTMGIAFLVMFPMAYTDVNDAWKLPQQKQRLRVGAAGILTELTIAAWATLCWTLLPDGVLRNGAFLLATTTWLSTLAINASPFLRFDGYFLLMDALELPNLHPRAFALARWRLREGLFALGEPQPEVFPARRHRMLLLFAWGTWLYRLIVFTGIAVLVYLMFPKPLGPLLAGVEITWFILRPIWRELVVWAQYRGVIMKRKRSVITLGILLLFCALVALPWDSRIHTQALLTPAVSTPLIVAGDARLEQMLVAQGSRVAPGQVIARLGSPDLLFQRRAAEARLRGLQWRSEASGLQAEWREQQQVLRAERQKVEAELRGIDELLAQYRLVAPQQGLLFWNSQDLAEGQWLAQNETLATVVDMETWQVHGYLQEYELDRIRVGDRARFYAESDRIAPLSLTISRIDTDATRVLNDGMLASARGGELLVREQGEQLIPELALYRVALELEEQPGLPLTGLAQLRGRLVIYGEPRAWSWHYWRSALALIRQEAGF
ncbi:hypothetical protein BFR47_05370 [Oceanisphaera psychrotolerans]|uniref:Peptidase M50 domain-containing protein n=1 Tax=Oceanisphaera psychrotolerans TaxID=1414654 RepID=A0A1J4QA96_9GAMM|nr:hypothetical protein BFR47_05370 [Oceanisphaera psychrotolerans]